MSTDDIVAFITARLDEDVADVREGAEWPKWNIAPSRMGARIRRVLRGVEAKRKVLAVARWLEDSGRTLAASEVRRALASEWGTHPDYRPDWSL